MAKLTAKTYGNALFELAIEENQIETLAEEVKVLQDLLEEHPDFSALMNHPQIQKEEKIQIAENVFSGSVSDTLMGFIRIILQKDRYQEIGEILDFFIEEVKIYRKIGTAYVTSAMPLSSVQKKDLEEKLLETTSFEKMEMHYRVDESLIGGMIIRIGDRVVDNSVKRQLERLTKQMLDANLQP